MKCKFNPQISAGKILVHFFVEKHFKCLFFCGNADGEIMLMEFKLVLRIISNTKLQEGNSSKVKREVVIQNLIFDIDIAQMKKLIQKDLMIKSPMMKI